MRKICEDLLWGTSFWLLLAESTRMRTFVWREKRIRGFDYLHSIARDVRKY